MANFDFINLDCTSKFFTVRYTIEKFRILKFPCFQILSDCKDYLSGSITVLGAGVNHSYVTSLWQAERWKHSLPV